MPRSISLQTTKARYIGRNFWRIAKVFTFLTLTQQHYLKSQRFCSDIAPTNYPSDFLNDGEDKSTVDVKRQLRRERLANLRYCLTEEHGAATPEVADTVGFVRMMGWDLLGQVVKEPWFLKWPGPDLKPNPVLRSVLLQPEGNPPSSDVPETFQSIHLNPAANEAFRELTLKAGLFYKAGEPNLFPGFPQSSRVLKAIWRRVPKGGDLKLGVWGGVSGIKNPESPRKASEWSDCVVVDAIGHAPTLDTKCPGGKVAQHVSVAEFFQFTVEDPGAIPVSFLSQKGTPNFGLANGDTMILVGLHLASKEIPDWTWSTFWWQPESTQDFPEFVEFVKDKPKSLREPKQRWKDFVGNTSISFLYPASERTATAKGGAYNVIFNPYLEAAELKYGTVSNCMSCHSRASTSGTIVRGTVRDSMEIGLETVKDFEGNTKTDYSWSLAIRTKLP